MCQIQAQAIFPKEAQSGTRNEASRQLLSETKAAHSASTPSTRNHLKAAYGSTVCVSRSSSRQMAFHLCSFNHPPLNADIACAHAAATTNRTLAWQWCS